MTIGKRLIGSFLIVALIFLFCSGFFYMNLKKMGGSYSNLIDHRVSVVINAKDIQNASQQQMNSLRDYLLTQNPDSIDQMEKANKLLKEKIQQTIPYMSTKEDRDALTKIDSMNLDFMEKTKKVVVAFKGNKNEAISSAYNAVFPIGGAIQNLADYVVTVELKSLYAGSADNLEMSSSIGFITLIVSLIGFVLSLCFGYFISRSISRPVRIMAELAEKISEGDLTIDNIHIKNRDEIGRLAFSFNKMRSNLYQLVQNIRSSSELVAASSEELTANAEESTRMTEQVTMMAQEVAAGAFKQVESIQESSQVMNDLSARIQNVTMSTAEVTESTNETLGIASNGNHSVYQAIHKMHSLNQTVSFLSDVIKGLGDRSLEIEKIITAIQDVSAQTNLLALNAAIEAARAGEHGRGFSVVAGEVRKLAEQSAKSAQTVHELIASIQQETLQAVETMNRVAEEVTEGLHAVDGAGKAFEQIQNSVDHVVLQNRKVTQAVENMAQCTSQVEETMNQIAMVASQSSAATQNVSATIQEQLASMEEVEASSTSLAKMAEELQSLIGKFQV
jgi:methyl-accepting chemotaxis protein